MYYIVYVCLHCVTNTMQCFKIEYPTNRIADHQAIIASFIKIQNNSCRSFRKKRTLGDAMLFFMEPNDLVELDEWLKN